MGVDGSPAIAASSKFDTGPVKVDTASCPDACLSVLINANSTN